MTKPGNDREAWLKGKILPEELDTLMAGNGQAEANARHVEDFFQKYPLPAGSRILIHGCGTCQVFDYINPANLGEAKITFADIGPEMLETARQRLARFKGFSYEIITDDIENTSIKGKYDAVLLSMLLLHVDWHKCLNNIAKLNPETIYIIEQEQETGTQITGAKNRLLPPSIKKYAEEVSVQLVPRRDLETFLANLGYSLTYTSEIQVPDDKVMAGFVFIKKPAVL